MIGFTSNWWDSLILFEKIYWIIAIPFTLIFLIQLILTLIGGGHDFDTDVDHDTSFDVDGADFQFFSIRNLIGFFTMFGWSGIASIHTFGLSRIALTIIISVLAGSLMMLIMASLFYGMSKMSHSGTLQMKNAIGKIGEVYLTIPARKGGLGKVQVKVQGPLRTLDAMTEERENIKTGTVIEVVDVINENILLVRRSR